MESNREHERLVNQNRRLLAKMSGLSLRLQSSIQTLSSIMELTAVPITAPNLEAAGRAILEILVRELNGVECCSLLMHVPEKNRLELLAAQGQDDLFDDRVGLFNERLAFTDGEGIAGRVFQENEALFVAPESPERQWLKTSPDLTTPKFLACLPLRQGGLPTGVLNISFNHAKTFDPPRRRDLILLGQVVANVIHAYMLKTELDEKAVSLEAKVRECELEIVERRRTEAKLAASLEDKEILLREIHHRVKNNMQVVSSLINLHSGKSRDARIAEIFGDCQSRLRTMALMHEILYRTDSPGRVDLDV
ncbi:MAG: GAF domain-containing protein, partial [Proteobacteria bacterium]|nr:GAF domain-containing protein [Pseudomonadota bacterium]